MRHNDAHQTQCGQHRINIAYGLVFRGSFEIGNQEINDRTKMILNRFAGLRQFESGNMQQVLKFRLCVEYMQDKDHNPRQDDLRIVALGKTRL